MCSARSPVLFLATVVKSLHSRGFERCADNFLYFGKNAFQVASSTKLSAQEKFGGENKRTNNGLSMKLKYWSDRSLSIMNFAKMITPQKCIYGNRMGAGYTIFTDNQKGDKS